uniref:Uncharacterized protein n=1 Tax=Plectus sambesii TaxID=2011161 RepID=A0A914ULP3_9BILA
MCSTAWFPDEICSMMYVFGDGRAPSVECAAIVEGVVKRQLATLTGAARNLAEQRGSREIGLEDLLFQLRNNRSLLRRLIAYAKARDRVSGVRTTSANAPCEDDDVMEVVEQDVEAADGKRARVLREAIGHFDLTGELLTLFDDETVDDIKRRRMEVMAERVAKMDEREHMRFTEARRVSLCSKNGARVPAQVRLFVQWLGIVGSDSDLVEALNFLATETVATIVDAACLLRIETFAASARTLSVSDLLSNVVNAGIGIQPNDAAVVASTALRTEHYREAIRRFPRTAQGNVIV